MADALAWLCTTADGPLVLVLTLVLAVAALGWTRGGQLPGEK
jgi:hypothetical protein